MFPSAFRWYAGNCSLKNLKESLLNAFTEMSKKYSPARFDLCQRKLSELFKLDEP